MMNSFGGGAAAFAAALLLFACDGGERAARTPASSTASAGPAGDGAPATAPSLAATPAQAGGWDLQSSGEGVALAYPASGSTAVRLFCPSGSDTILVNVPAFRAIGSEERLSFGSGGSVEALVADTRGDKERGGVSAVGTLPSNLGALISGPISINYGAQTSGPHSAPPRAMARAFLAGCGFPPPATVPPPHSPPSAGATATTSHTARVSACMMQDGKPLAFEPLRAIGTEPFWGAEIEGRCVTYSHPDNQQGTRVWTRYTPRGGGGIWSGALNGRPFVLRTRRQPGCSDGMSDRRYPIAVELTVGGEERRGCAETG